jgi:FtsH-binding integral membrane protein
MDSQALVQAHTAISLIAIVLGFVVLFGMLRAQHLHQTALWFLATTFLTTLTGFIFFRRDQILPSHITGIVALIVLAPTVYALFLRKLAGGWRRAYVIGAVISLYLNMFVLVVQLFLKVPAIHALAPNAPVAPEPPFKIAQGLVFVLFLVLGWLAVRRFRSAPIALAGSPTIVPR